MRIEREGVFAVVTSLVLGFLIAIPMYALGWLTPTGGLSPTAVQPQPTAQDVLQSFRDESLEVAYATNVEDDPNWQKGVPVPKTYKEAYRFSMPSLGNDSMGEPKGTGKVFIFDSSNDLRAVQDYYQGFSGMLASHIYTNNAETVLLQMPAGDVPKAKADRYGNVLKEKY